MIKNPGLLRSEEHHLRNRALDITESKGKPFVVQPVDLPKVSNPIPSIEERPKSRG